MTQVSATAPAPLGFAKNIIELAKPRVNTLVLFTTACGYWLAPTTDKPLAGTLAFLFATSMLVASANTLNCWIERTSDGLMHRTRNRPLPSGRMAPGVALVWGTVLGIGALATLYFTSNLLTATLGAIALSTYVLLYTPLKRVSPVALYIGSLPGALPPLMGWTYATGGLATAGWFLFAILFIWQIPHFIAISVYLEEDYRRGGMRVLPIVKGGPAAWRQMIWTTGLLVVVSMAAIPLNLTGPAYIIVALAAGGAFFLSAVHGSKTGSVRAGRNSFIVSIIYLVVTIAALILDKA